MHLHEIIDQAELNKALEANHVRQQIHPSEPLAILNYTETCAYEDAWNPTTLACRGLIYRTDTGEAVARGYVKFFNYGQIGAAEIPLDAKVHVSDKADGCFPRGTALNLWGGGTVTIDEVVRKRLPVTLVGMNEHGEFVPALVTEWHDNGRKDLWLDIEVDAPVSRVSGAGGHANRLRVTVNHHIHVDGSYRPACEARPGDTLITQTWEPSTEVINLVRASLLGDGCLVPSATKPGQAKYQEAHTIKQADYVHALRKAVGECAADRADTISGYGSALVWAGSREYAALGALRQEWYPEGVKRVPADLSWLDDFAVAKWLMDDGHRQHFKAQADRISFATNSFLREDIVRLGDRLAEMYGVSYHLQDDSGRGIALVINSGRRQQLARLWEAIAPHVHPSMRYKLPAAYREVPYVELLIGRELVIPRSASVVSVTPVEATKQNFPHGRTGYDITTTTHNYLARGVLVHNSLGIIYPMPSGGWAVATRGSFASEQAIHATQILGGRYADYRPAVGVTTLVEIVYPENRIVLDYAGMDDLILLGAVEVATGAVLAASEVPAWVGPRTQTFEAGTLAEALAMPPRSNAEGVVVRDLTTGAMAKIKQADYIELHRIVTNLTARKIHEWLMAGKFLGDFIAPLPDEFHAWCHQIAEDIAARVDGEYARLTAAYDDVVDQVIATHVGWRPGDRAARKDFAMIAARHPDSWALFALLDRRDIRPELLKRADPGPFLTPTGRTYSEDNA